MKPPIEKAIELRDTFYIVCQEFTEEIQCSIQAIECALKAVDEIIESRKDDKSFDDREFAKSSDYFTPHPMGLTYWLLVKTELNKLN